MHTIAECICGKPLQQPPRYETIIMQYRCALTIAGSDSVGGAGIQADIKTMSALGVYAASAITAVTVQNTQGVYGIEAIRPEIVGGHLDGNTKTDILYADGQRVETYEALTVETRNTHGTGYTLSSAITAHLALGHTMADAIRLAKTYLYKALEAGKDVEIGRGHGPVNHFFDPHPYYTK